ncbi:histidine phosphatase family protein [Thermoactinomyces mirandus]|uniref:Histidine phosphatase family protein n=1 Tax=Thermoactinomyces mirandus TaxID=2756294 RepID=A0A7W2AQM4_9BACL|nr:histidine phosphatase family protein [Thermoactinomyces mirandus]MBA4601447.1 histidine phosphatase family protein [Thermoactinomyces mirandus]
MNTRIFLIRHGETEWNKERRYQGHQNVPLSELGRKQAGQLAVQMQTVKFDAIYASDLWRARETARIIADKHQLPVNCSVDFRERYCGEWEGQTHEELVRKYPDWAIVNPVGGKYGIEPTGQVQKRFLRKCEALARQHLGGQIAIVAHGFCITVFLQAITMGEYGTKGEQLLNTSCTCLIYHEDGKWQIEKYNDVSHLK